MKTMIAIPCMESVPYRFVESLISLTPVGETTIQFLSGSLIYEARNQLLIKAIEKGYDYILWLDSDMVFDEDTLPRLFEGLGDGDMISGTYFTRRAKPLHTTLFSKAGYEEQNGMAIPDSEEMNDIHRGIVEVEGCGFGCVLMKVEMAHKVLQKFGLPFTPLFGFGEDLSFCIRARKLGYKVMADTDLVLGHLGNVVIDEEYARVINEN